MEPNETEVLDSTNETEKTENQPIEETIEPKEDVEALKKQIATLEAQKNHWKEKAEKPKPEPVKQVENKENDSLTPKDYLALTEQKVSAEDFDEVVRISKIIGKPIAEALRDKTMKTILAERMEERRTAEAMNTNKGGTRSAPKVSGDEILANVRKGKLPTEDEDIDKYADAFLASRRTKRTS